MAREFSQLNNKAPRGKKVERAPEVTLTAEQSQTRQDLNCPLGPCRGDCPGCGGKGLEALRTVAQGGTADPKALEKLIGSLQHGDKVVDLLLSGKPESKILAEKLIANLEEIHKLKADIDAGKIDPQSPEFKKLMEQYSVPNLLLESGYSLKEIQNLGIATNSINPGLYQAAVQNGGMLPNVNPQQVAHSVATVEPTVVAADSPAPSMLPKEKGMDSQVEAATAPSTGVKSDSQPQTAGADPQPMPSAPKGTEMPKDLQATESIKPAAQKVAEPQLQTDTRIASANVESISKQPAIQQLETYKPEPVRSEPVRIESSRPEPAVIYNRQVANEIAPQRVPESVASQVVKMELVRQPAQNIAAYNAEQVARNYNNVSERTVVAPVTQNSSELNSRQQQNTNRAVELTNQLNSRAIAEAQINNRLNRIPVNVVDRELAFRNLRDISREIKQAPNRITSATTERIRETVARLRQVDSKDPVLQRLEKTINNQLLNKQLSRLEQILNSSKLTPQMLVRLVSKQLQDVLKSLSKAGSTGLSAEAADRMRKLLDRLVQMSANRNGTAGLDSKKLDALIRQIRLALNNNDKKAGVETTKQTTTSRADLNRLARIEGSEKILLNRLTHLQNRLKAQQASEQKNLDKLTPKERMELRNKEKGLKEQIDRLEKMLARVGQQKKELIDRLARATSGNPVANEASLRRAQDMSAIRSMLLAVMRNAQLNSIEFKTILSIRLAALLRENSQNSNNSDVEAQRIKRLMTIQQILREGQELSAAMMEEMLELLSATQEEGEGSIAVTRKGKRVTKTKKVNKSDREGFGLKLEESTKKQKDLAKAAKAQAAVAASSKSSQSAGLEKSGPSGALDIFQAKVGGKGNAYYSEEELEEGIPAIVS